MGTLRLDRQRAIAVDEFEKLPNRALVLVGREQDRPGEVSAFRVEIGENGEVTDLAGDLAGSQIVQLAQQDRRLVRLGVEAGLRLEVHADDVSGLRVARGLAEQIVHGNSHGREVEFAQVLVFRRCGGGAVDEPLQVAMNAGAYLLIDAAAVARGGDDVGENVGAAQQHLDDLRIGLDRIAAQQIEHGFERVREADELIHLEGAGAALDRMDGPEHGIDGVGVGRAALDGVEAGLEFGELFFAFLEERLTYGSHRVQGRPPLEKCFRRRRGEPLRRA